MDRVSRFGRTATTYRWTAMPQEATMAEHYTAPRLTTLGSLAELTLRNKKFGTRSDGDFLCEDDGSTATLYTVS